MHNAWKSAFVLAVLTACGGDGDGGTPPPPTSVFTSLTVSPASPQMVDGDTVQLTATPRDQNGAAMSNLPPATFALTQGTSVSVSGAGRVIAEQVGASVVTATLTSGNVTRTATSNPNVAALGTTANVTAAGNGQTFSPPSVKIAVNGTVTWAFPGPETHNVTFAAAEPPGGDIGNRNSGVESRNFTVAGSYPYQCSLHAGMNGSVIVRTP